VRKDDFKYIYGPVSSWRLGISLGIDLFSSKKICNFSCIYCQLGRTLVYATKPKLYVKTAQVISELKRLPHIKIDYITFSGSGEPSLAENLGEAIKAVKKLNIAPVAILTNSTLFNQKNIRKDLSFADYVIAKLDAFSQASLEKINRPAKTIRFDSILRGIRQFRHTFKGKFALQIMFVKKNKKDAKELARLTKIIAPDEVQINTPLRTCAVKPLSKKEIEKIKKYFSGLNSFSVYDVRIKKVTAVSKKETLKRRGK